MIIKCLICKKPITEEELLYEDYYKVFRGENASYYEGKRESHFICFNCIKRHET